MNLKLFIAQGNTFKSGLVTLQKVGGFYVLSVDNTPTKITTSWTVARRELNNLLKG